RRTRSSQRRDHAAAAVSDGSGDRREPRLELVHQRRVALVAARIELALEPLAVGDRRRGQALELAVRNRGHAEREEHLAGGGAVQRELSTDPVRSAEHVAAVELRNRFDRRSATDEQIGRLAALVGKPAQARLGTFDEVFYAGAGAGEA